MPDARPSNDDATDPFDMPDRDGFSAPGWTIFDRLLPVVASTIAEWAADRGVDRGAVDARLNICTSPPVVRFRVGRSLRVAAEDVEAGRLDDDPMYVAAIVWEILDGLLAMVIETCPSCDGKGVVPMTDQDGAVRYHTCNHCRGKGEHPEVWGDGY